MPQMDGMEALRQELLDGTAQQSRAGDAEEHLSLMVDLQDTTSSVDDEHRIGSQLQERLREQPRRYLCR
jgi:hypothetical protein